MAATKSAAKRNNKRPAKGMKVWEEKVAMAFRRAFGGLSKADLLDVACALHAVAFKLQIDKDCPRTEKRVKRNALTKPGSSRQL